MVFSSLQALISDKRPLFLLIGLGCFFLLGVGYFLEYVVGLAPCALCIIQRGFFLGIGMVALLGAWHDRFAKRYVAALFVLALLGGAVAMRNVYIQLVPPGLGTQCIPWLESVTDMIAVLFQATGDCSERNWTLLFLSVPEWSLIAFSFLALFTGFLLWDRPAPSED